MVPKAPNRVGLPYTIQEATETGQKNYDTVAFYVKDFGQVMMVSVRRIPQVALDIMAKDDPHNVLKNLAAKALFDWRDFPEEPRVVEDNVASTPYGEAVLRVYNAPRGSLLEKLQGGSGKGFQPFDVMIGVMVLRKKDHYVYAIGENDEAPGATDNLKKALGDLFATISVPDVPPFEKAKK